jgi:hypothetical protein
MPRWQLAQSRQSAQLFLQSSKLGLPHPHTQATVYPPPLVRGKHNRLREMGWGTPNSDEGTDTVIL